MKKMLLSVVMGALLLIGSLSMISMTPPPNTECAQFAKEFAEELEELGISNGEFLSACNVCLNEGQGKGSQGVCACKAFLSYGEFEQLPPELGITNFGQCVNFVKNFQD